MLLGIDLGERRIGLALGDTRTGVARPLATIRRATPERDARTLARLIAEHGVVELVVGLPRNSDGSDGPQVEATRAWCEQVLPALGLPMTWRDERWTSQAAEALLGRPRRGRSGGPPSPAARAARRAAVDREAARLILQAELDARSGATGRTAMPSAATATAGAAAPSERLTR